MTTISVFVHNPPVPPSTAASILVSSLLIFPAPVMAWAADQLPPAKTAGSHTPSADEAFERGLDAYDARRFTEAVEFFERSYRESQDPALLFNMAQSWRLAGNCRRARDLYLRFIQEAPRSADRPRAEEQARKLGACGETVVPIQQPPSVPVVATTLSSPSKSLARSDRGVSQRTAAAIVAGLGVGLAVAAGISAWEARDLSNQTAAFVSQGRPWDDAADALDRDGKQAQTRAIVLTATALVAAAVVTILFLRSGHSETTP